MAKYSLNDDAVAKSRELIDAQPVCARQHRTGLIACDYIRDSGRKPATGNRGRR